MTVKKQKGRGIRRGDTNAQRRAASRENRERLYGPRPENWTSLPSHKWGGGSTDLKLAEIYRKQGIPLPRDLQDRADYAFRQKKKTTQAEVDAFRAKFGITPLAQEGMREGVDLSKYKTQASDVTRAPETTQQVSTEKPPGILGQAAQDIMNRPGIFEKQPITAEQLAGGRSIWGAQLGMGELAEGAMLGSAGFASPTGPIEKGLGGVEKALSTDFKVISLRKTIANWVAKGVARIKNPTASIKSAAGFVEKDATFIKGLKQNIKLKKGDWIGNMVKHDRVKRETIKYLNQEANTKNIGLVSSYLQNLAKSAKNPLIVLGVLGTVAYTSLWWAPNEKGDALTSLRLSLSEAAEMEDWEMVDEIDEALQETLEIIPFIPADGFIRSELSKFNAAALESKLIKRESDRARENQTVWDIRSREQEAKKTEERAYWGNVTEQRAKEKEEDKKYWEKKNK